MGGSDSANGGKPEVPIGVAASRTKTPTHTDRGSLKLEACDELLDIGKCCLCAPFLSMFFGHHAAYLSSFGIYNNRSRRSGRSMCRLQLCKDLTFYNDI